MALPTFTPGTMIKASEMNQALATLFDMMYPVGSIYMSATMSTAAQVGAALGGTWQAWGAGRVPVGVDTNDTDFDTAEETGGEKTHTLTVQEMPSHNHDLVSNGGPGSDYSMNWEPNLTRVYAQIYTKDTGGGDAHNNLQPYITCYMYKRTA